MPDMTFSLDSETMEAMFKTIVFTTKHGSLLKISSFTKGNAFTIFIDDL